jgi:hypothetical protein
VYELRSADIADELRKWAERGATVDGHAEPTDIGRAAFDDQLVIGGRAGQKEAGPEQ